MTKNSSFLRKNVQTVPFKRMSTLPAGSSLLFVNQNSISHVSVNENCSILFSGFFYCKDTCYLTASNVLEGVREGELVEEAQDCHFFQRNVMDKTDFTTERDLRSLTQLLFELTGNGSLYFTLEESEGIPAQTYVADKVLITKPAVGEGRDAVDETERFQSIIDSMSVLTANKVNLEVEVVEQTDDVSFRQSQKVESGRCRS